MQRRWLDWWGWEQACSWWGHLEAQSPGLDPCSKQSVGLWTSPGKTAIPKVETEWGTSPPRWAPFSLTHRQDLASSFSNMSQLQEESLTVSPSTDRTFQKLENTFYFYTVCSEKLELLTGLHQSYMYCILYVYIIGGILDFTVIPGEKLTRRAQNHTSSALASW